MKLGMSGHRVAHGALRRAVVALAAAAFGLGCVRKPEAGSTTPAPPRDFLSDACRAPDELATTFYGEDAFPSQSCRAQADALIAKMNLRQKLAQMVQIGQDQLGQPGEVTQHGFGSVLSGGGGGPDENNPLNWAEMVRGYFTASLEAPLGIPILYGVDAVHGHSNVREAVIFPHNIGLGATRDADLVRRAARITALEMSATGIPWTFAPVVAMARDERWGRTYEAFGETTELVTELGVAAILGLQGERLGADAASVLACAKHYLGDGATGLGVDQGDAPLGDEAVRELLLPPYRAAVEAGVGSVMVSYSSLSGVKMHCHGPWVTDVLKRELGFNGFVVSDWEAIDRLPAAEPERLAAALTAGIDLIMHPRSRAAVIPVLESLVPAHVPEARVDDAVRRILSVKCELGLFDATRRHALTRINHARLANVGSPQHRAVAREAVAKSLVVLKNDRGLLPLSKELGRVHVSGRHGHDIGLQSGGWTITWEGSPGATTPGTTLREAVEQTLGAGRATFHAQGEEVAGADVALVAIGEEPYAEMKGDRTDLSVRPEHVELVERAKAAGVPTVVVLITGRPLILGRVLDMADALVVAWLPGTEGGGMTDVIFGDVAPAGKLPHSWPRRMEQLPLNVGDEHYDPLFAYGFGLTYPARQADHVPPERVESVK